MRHLEKTWLVPLVDSGLLIATADMERLSKPDAFLILAPSVHPHPEPGLSSDVVNTIRMITDRLGGGQMVN